MHAKIAAEIFSSVSEKRKPETKMEMEQLFKIDMQTHLVEQLYPNHFLVSAMYYFQGLLTVITITGNYHYRIIFSLPLPLPER